MPVVKIVNMSGKEVGDITLSDKLFGADVNGAVLHAAVREYLMTVHPDPYRGVGRRKEALETEGDRQSPSGFHPQPAVDARRRRAGAEAERLSPCDEQEDPSARAVLRTVR